jgi:hypothetical protein
MIVKSIGIGCSLVVGTASVFFLNQFIIEPLIIPDPCIYHGEETNALFNVFYKFESSEGYHPAPTHFNFILTLLAGVACGYYLYKAGKSLVIDQIT